MLLLSITIFLVNAAVALALVIVCCRRSYQYWNSSAMITTLPQAVTEGKKANFEYITGKPITLEANLQPVAYVSRAAIARRSAANHANVGQEDSAMVDFLVYLNWKLATDPDSEFEVNCKAVPATD